MLRSLLIKAVVLYCVVLTFLFFYQRNLMYFPDEERPDYKAWGISLNPEISVQTSDGLEISGWYSKPQKSTKPVIIYFHGNAENHAYRTDSVGEYISAGYGVLLAGYRGYGGNPGSPSEQGLYADARAYIEWLNKNQNISASNIIVFGESLGSGVATQMAKEFAVGAVILQAPYTSTAAVAQKTYFYVPVSLVMKDQYRSIEKIADIQAPLFVIHGAEDPTIPVYMGKELYHAAKQSKELFIIAGGKHNDLQSFGVQSRVLEFLDNIDFSGE